MRTISKETESCIGEDWKMTSKEKSRAELEAEVNRLRAAIRRFLTKGLLTTAQAAHIRWNPESYRPIAEVLVDELEQLEAALPNSEEL